MVTVLLSGHVRSSTDGAPIPGAEIELTVGVRKLSARSGPDGAFNFTIAAHIDQAGIRVRHGGFREFSASMTTASPLEVGLIALPQKAIQKAIQKEKPPSPS